MSYISRFESTTVIVLEVCSIYTTNQFLFPAAVTPQREPVFFSPDFLNVTEVCQLQSQEGDRYKICVPIHSEN